MRRPDDFVPATRGQHHPSVFWGELNERELMRRYWQVCPSILSTLRITWDYSKEARYQNDEVDDDYLNKCDLFECSSAAFCNILKDPRNYVANEDWSNLVSTHYCRLAGQWELGRKISPPVFEQGNDGLLSKKDGFHRIVIALAARSPKIPFFCVFHSKPRFIRHLC